MDNAYFNFVTSVVGVFIAMFGEKVRRIFWFLYVWNPEEILSPKYALFMQKY